MPRKSKATLENEKNLKDFEEDMFIGAFRYYMGRQTILSASIPVEFIELEVYKKCSHRVIEIIIRDLEDHIRMFKYFGNPTIDNSRWRKLLSFLKGYKQGYFKTYTSKRFDNGEPYTFEGFECEHYLPNPESPEKMDMYGYPENLKSEIRIYPVERFLKEPYAEIFLLEEDLIKPEEA